MESGVIFIVDKIELVCIYVRDYSIGWFEIVVCVCVVEVYVFVLLNFICLFEYMYDCYVLKFLFSEYLCIVEMLFLCLFNEV